jgi:hypothetical protein
VGGGYKLIGAGAEGFAYLDESTNKVLKVFKNLESFTQEMRGNEIYREIDPEQRYTITGTAIGVPAELTEKGQYALVFEYGGANLSVILKLLTPETKDTFLKGIISLFIWMCTVVASRKTGFHDLNDPNFVSRSIAGPFKLIDLGIIGDPWSPELASHNMDTIHQYLTDFVSNSKYKDIPMYSKGKDLDTYIRNTLAFLNELNERIGV